MKFTTEVIAAPDGLSQQVQDASNTLADSLMSLIEAAKPIPAATILGILDSIKFLILQDILDQVTAANAPAPVPSPAPTPTTTQS